MFTEASLLKPRREDVNQRDANDELDMLYAMLEQPWKTSSQSDSTKTEKKLVKFEGIGPTDDQTGVPIATRTVSTGHTMYQRYIFICILLYTEENIILYYIILYYIILYYIFM